MAASGKCGARAAIDWEHAFAFYAALPPAERSYAVVAAEFGVSVRTVETHGREEQWKARLREIKDEARSRTAEALTEARVEEIEKLRRLIDASEVVYAEALRNGMRMSPADLERLNRLSVALLDEATAPRATSDDRDHEPPPRTLEHARAVLDALAETGALEALGLSRIPPNTNQPPDQEVDADE
jgi:hypothetical protein